MDLARETAKTLLTAGAVSLSPNAPYTFASGIKSPIYCDNRLLISNPVERKKIVSGFLTLIDTNKLHFDVVAGTATAGIPWAAWISHELDKPLVYIRGAFKTHGKGNQIEGRLKEGAQVLLIEDLISTGGSSLAAVAAVREAGAKLIGCAAIFTYQMKAAEMAFANASIPLYTLTQFGVLVDVAIELKKISPEQKKNLMRWQEDPQAWVRTLAKT